MGVCNAPKSAPKPTGEAAEKSLGKVKCKGINQLISQGDGLKPTARAVTARGSRVSLSQPSRVPGNGAHFVDSQPKPPKPQSSCSEPAPGAPSRLSPPVSKSPSPRHLASVPERISVHLMTLQRPPKNSTGLCRPSSSVSRSRHRGCHQGSEHLSSGGDPSPSPQGALTCSPHL